MKLLRYRWPEMIFPLIGAAAALYYAYAVGMWWVALVGAPGGLLFGGFLAVPVFALAGRFAWLGCARESCWWRGTAKRVGNGRCPECDGESFKVVKGGGYREVPVDGQSVVALAHLSRDAFRVAVLPGAPAPIPGVPLPGLISASPSAAQTGDLPEAVKRAAETIAGDVDESAAPVAPEELSEGMEIVRLLGVGGMGQVYLVRDLLTDELYAAKVTRALDPRGQVSGSRNAAGCGHRFRMGIGGLACHRLDSSGRQARQCIDDLRGRADGVGLWLGEHGCPWR